MKVTIEDIELGLIKSIEYYEGEISFTEGVDSLVKAGVSRGSASHLVNYVKWYMSPNYVPKMTMSIINQTIYFRGVTKRYGTKGAMQWAENDLKHFDYYESVQDSKVIGRRKNLKKLLEEIK